MALPFRISQGVVGVAPESPANTYTKPTSVQAFHARNIQVKPTGAVVERNVTRSHFGQLDDIHGAAEMEISFEVDLAPGQVPVAFIPNGDMERWTSSAVPEDITLDTGTANLTFSQVSASPHGGQYNLRATRAGTNVGGISFTGIKSFELSTWYRVRFWHRQQAGSIGTPVNLEIRNTTRSRSVQSDGTTWTATTPTAALTNAGSVNWTLYQFAFQIEAGSSITDAYSFIFKSTWTTANWVEFDDIIVEGPFATTPGTADSFPLVVDASRTSGVAKAGTLPFWDTAMMACALQRTVVTDTSVAYKPNVDFAGGTAGGVTQPSESYSVSVWESDGSPGSVRHSLKGGCGTVTLETAQGQPVSAKYSFKGAYVAAATDAIGVEPVDVSVNPTAFLGATLTVHGVATAAIDGFSFDKGNVLSKRADSKDTNGVLGFWITAHKPMVKIAPELLSLTAKDFFAIWKAGTSSAGFNAQAGTTPARITLASARVQAREIGLSEREGARVNDMSLNFTTAGTDAAGADFTLTLD